MVDIILLLYMEYAIILNKFVLRKEMRLMYKIISVILLIVFASGCSIHPNNATSVLIYTKDNPLSIKILSDADQTTLGFGIGSHRIYNNNYRHAFGMAALSAKELGYKYFKIIEPKELIKQYKARKVTNARNAIDACTRGKGSYTTISFFGNVKLCNSIVYTYSQNVLTRGTVNHAEIYFWIQMTNKFEKDNRTFSVEDVLTQKDVQKMLKEHPEKLDTIKTFLHKYKK